MRFLLAGEEKRKARRIGALKRTPSIGFACGVSFGVHKGVALRQVPKGCGEAVWLWGWAPLTAMSLARDFHPVPSASPSMGKGRSLLFRFSVPVAKNFKNYRRCRKPVSNRLLFRLCDPIDAFTYFLDIFLLKHRTLLVRSFYRAAPDLLMTRR